MSGAIGPVLTGNQKREEEGNVSDEEFHKFWIETHGPLFCSFPIFQQKALKYNQIKCMHVVPQQAVLEEQGGEHGLPVMEFDGVAEVWFEDIESLGSVLRDPGYLETVLPDMNKMVNEESSKFMFGYDVVPHLVSLLYLYFRRFLHASFTWKSEFRSP